MILKTLAIFRGGRLIKDFQLLNDLQSLHGFAKKIQENQNLTTKPVSNEELLCRKCFIDSVVHLIE